MKSFGFLSHDDRKIFCSCLCSDCLCLLSISTIPPCRYGIHQHDGLRLLLHRVGAMAGLPGRGIPAKTTERLEDTRLAGTRVPDMVEPEQHIRQFGRLGCVLLGTSALTSDSYNYIFFYLTPVMRLH